MVSLDDFEVRSGAMVLSVPEGVEDLPPSHVTDLALDSCRRPSSTSPGPGPEETSTRAQVSWLLKVYVIPTSATLTSKGFHAI